MKSMTGQGRAQWKGAAGVLLVEVRSVNHRFFKCSLRLPEAISDLSAELEAVVRKAFSRGSIEVELRWLSARQEDVVINEELVRHFARQVQRLNAELGLNGELRLETLLAIPGVLQPVPREETFLRKKWELVRKRLEVAVNQCARMRQREGRRTAQQLRGMLSRMRQTLGRIRERSRNIVPDYHRKLTQKVETLLHEHGVGVEKNDLLREMAIFAERCDLSEELQRLDSHLAEFGRLLGSKKEVGKRLEFLGQELLRESNTVGSKANDARVQHEVIALKGDIERIREQAQNME